MNLTAYQNLVSQLEYADLRELQDVLAARSLWPQFEHRFGNKELVATRFDQLVELRNRIRHSRQVTDITRKDGEAAILWFTEALG